MLLRSLSLNALCVLFIRVMFVVCVRMVVLLIYCVLWSFILLLSFYLCDDSVVHRNGLYYLCFSVFIAPFDLITISSPPSSFLFVLFARIVSYCSAFASVFSHSLLCSCLLLYFLITFYVLLILCWFFLFLFFYFLRRPPCSTLFPSTPLSRASSPTVLLSPLLCPLLLRLPSVSVF